jgi:two-component system, LytTR family, response regulator
MFMSIANDVGVGGMSDALRMVVVEDDDGARVALVRELHNRRDLLLVGEARGAADALRLIERRQPQVALVSLRLPGVDGLELSRLVRHGTEPVYILLCDPSGADAGFLSDYELLQMSRHATEEELDEVLAEVRLRCGGGRAKRAEVLRMQAAAQAWTTRPGLPVLRELAARDRDSVRIVPLAGVVLIVAEGSVTRLETVDGEHFTTPRRLLELERRLDPVRWLRFSRGVLVNRDHVTSVRAGDAAGSPAEALLSNGQRVTLSPTRFRALRDQLGG